MIVQVPGQADFAAEVGTSFDLVAGSEHVPMQLASCEDRGSDERFEQCVPACAGVERHGSLPLG